MNEKLIDKLRKLLRLGTSSNQHEAELAMQKALEIAQAHGIELSNISVEVNQSDIGEDSIQFGQRMPIVSEYVFSILQLFFNVKVIQTGNRLYGRQVILVGSQDHIYTAKYIYDFLADAMDRSWKSYYSVRYGIGLAERKNYFLGFYNGLKHKLDEQKRQTEEQNTNLALMVVNNGKAFKLTLKINLQI